MLPFCLVLFQLRRAYVEEIPGRLSAFRESLGTRLMVHLTYENSKPLFVSYTTLTIHSNFRRHFYLLVQEYTFQYKS